jgi:hypothetical protein
LSRSLAGGGSDFFQAAGQEFFSHYGEVGVPSEPHAELSGGAAIGSVHELDVLHVLARGAVDDGGDGFGHVVVGGESELVEGGEEVIVTRLVARSPVAHRPRVNDLVVEDVVVVGAADSGFRRVMFAGIAGGAHQARSGAVHAEVVVRGKIEQIFRVDRAVEVIVQVAALGDVVQKSQQHGGLAAKRIEIARCSLLGRLRCGESRQKKSNQTATSPSPHRQVHEHSFTIRKGIVIRASRCAPIPHCSRATLFGVCVYFPFWRSFFVSVAVRNDLNRRER